MTDEKEEKPKIRCAIYTRKSTTEGLDQDFTSLDAQRESGENYIKSQQHQGWVTLPERYDDGGFTGASTDRPALQQLMLDIKAKKLDCIVVYKVDRLSRSLSDFVNLLQLFEENKVTFVSVTQHFNTNTSMGRLTLNILLSFAQFEREIISERTKDKMRAARTKGKFVGGRPALGYDRDPTTKMLVINPKEAAIVRMMFDLYLEKKSLLDVASALNEKGFLTKIYKGKEKPFGGGLFTNTTIQFALRNVTYVGRVSYEGKIYAGHQERIIDEEVFTKVQETLKKNHRVRGISKNRKFQGILTGLLRCAPCKCSMGHGYAIKNQYKYRYYTCLNGIKHGRAHCPTRSISAGFIEDKCLELLMQLTKDDRLKELAWSSLVLETQMAVIQSLVKEVEYDGIKGKLRIQLKDDSQRHEFDLPLDQLKKKLPNDIDTRFKGEPLIRKQLLLAHQIREMLADGRAKSLEQIAKWLNLSKTRLEQIANLLFLSPTIQEEIVCGDPSRLLGLTERALRPVAAELDWTQQTASWQKILA